MASEPSKKLKSSAGRRRKFRPASVGPSFELRFNRASSRFACCGRSVIVWDLEPRSKLEKIHPFKHPSHLEWSPDGHQLAIKSTSGDLVLVMLGSASEAIWLRRRGGEGAEVAFSACGNYLVDCSWSGQVDVFDIRTNEIVHTERIPNASIRSLAYDRVRTRFAYVVSPRATSPNRPGAPDYLALRNWPFWQNAPVVLPVDAQDIEAIAFSPDGSHLVMAVSDLGNSDSRVQIRALDSDAVVAEANYSFYASGKSVAWCSGSDVIANVEQGGVRLYDSSLRRALAFLPVEYPSHVEFSPCGTYVGVGAWGKGFVCSVEEVLATESAQLPAALPPDAGVT